MRLAISAAELVVRIASKLIWMCLVFVAKLSVYIGRFSNEAKM